MAKLTIALCIRNEAENLPACLESAAFADEIVVLLDRSTDESEAIARAAGAKVVAGAWEIESDRRNAAIAAAEGPFILELDADERIEPALASEIRAALAAPTADIFEIPFANHIGGRLIRWGWGAYNGTQAKKCLFRKGSKIWGRGRVHPAIAFTGTQARLATPVTHYVYQDIAAIFAKLNRYSDLRGQDIAESGQAGSRAAATRRFFTRFWKAYVSRRGYKEGHYGFALGLMAGLFPLLSHLKAQEILARQPRKMADAPNS